MPVGSTRNTILGGELRRAAARRASYQTELLWKGRWAADFVAELEIKSARKGTLVTGSSRRCSLSKNEPARPRSRRAAVFGRSNRSARGMERLIRRLSRAEPLVEPRADLAGSRLCACPAPHDERGYAGRPPGPVDGTDSAGPVAHRQGRGIREEHHRRCRRQVEQLPRRELAFAEDLDPRPRRRP